MATSFDIASQSQAGVLSGTSQFPSLSADGNLVAFVSLDAVSAQSQVYVKNETTGTLTILSQSTTGTTGNADSLEPTLSSDGTKVAFTSVATNLVSGASSGNSQIYLKSIATGGLQLVSQTATGTLADGSSTDPVVSSDGNLVAFDSSATTFNLGATGGLFEAYVKNLTTGGLVLVSQTAGGTIANANSVTDGISADGHLVLFQTAATDLGSTSGTTQIYAKNLTTGVLTILSQTSGGLVGNAASLQGALSADGSIAVFTSVASNLVAGATSGNSEVYVKTLATGALTLVSQKADGTIANGTSSNAVASADGKYVMFESTATNLDAAATSGTQQVYIKNLQTGAVTLLSKTSAGLEGNGTSLSAPGNAQAFSSDDTKITFATNATNLATPSGGVEVILRAVTSAPAVTLNSSSAGTAVNAAEAAQPVIFSGTSDQIGASVEVDLDTSGNKLGTAIVKTDGTWSLSASLSGLSQGSHKATASVQGSSYLSTTSTAQTFTFATTAPDLTLADVSFTDSGVKGDGLTDSGAVTLSGSVSAATGVTKVEVFDGTTDLGSATINGSAWSLAAILGEGTHSTFSATATDAAGNSTTATRSSSVTVDLTAPTVAFTQGVMFKSAQAATLTGTVADALGVASVEVFDGSKDLGSAQLNGDGTWSLAASLSAGDHSALSAVATDSAGNQTTAGADFLLQTGIRGGPFASYEADFDADGNLIAEIFSKKSGAVYQSDRVTNFANGNHLIDYNAGTTFKSQDFYRKTDLFDSNYNPMIESLYNNDGTHSVTGLRNGLHLKSLGNDVMTGGGLSETFVFTRHPGQETITDFNATNPGHDTISLAKGRFSSIDQIVQSLQQVGHDVLIDLGQSSSVTIQNVTVATLQNNRQDFKLHG